MNVEKINIYPKRLRILVAPLDWGLGHATRCIPIIHTLLKNNADVLLAATGNLRILLQTEFPQVRILDLEGYNITYARQGKFFFYKLIIQLPKVFSAIRKEGKWLENIVREERVDAVISDNRPGLHHSRIPCVYLTHQLQIQTGKQVTDRWLRKLHYAFIDKFQQCWIPDNEKGLMLAGKLSHPISVPKTKYKYIGLLSRFQRKDLTKVYDFLLLISGPEPQRGILETKLLQAFENSGYSFALVRGLPSKSASVALKTSASIVFDHLNANDLNDMVLQSNTIISRAGYSTIMDLAKLKKKAVLIPTPGQTEQEYLAEYLNEKKIFASIRQEAISLSNIEQAANKDGFNVPEYEGQVYEQVIEEWLSSIHYSKAVI